MRIVLLGLLGVLMLALHQLHASFPSDVGSRAALTFGFLLLAGFLLGEVFAGYVPRITGYLFAGMFCGPYLLGLVDEEVIRYMGILDELALVLIAYTAGAELKISRLRERARSITSISVIQTTFVFLSCTSALWLLSRWLPVFEGLEGSQILAVAAVLGMVATAKSPATAVAVIVETRARGPITDSVLGVTVLKDIIVLAGFSVLMAAVVPLFSAGAGGSFGLGRLLLDVFLSLAGGGAFGLLMVLYLRYVGKQTVLFVVGSAFLIISIAHTFHLNDLLLAVAAGFVVENFSRQGSHFLEGLERAAGPVFLIFFCLAGAGLNLAVLVSMWGLALFYILLRAGTTVFGTWIGAIVAKDSKEVRRLAWSGFIGQAGVSLGLAAIVRSQIPERGGMIADLIVGGIVVNQVVGPVVFRWALLRAGEGQS